MQHQSTEAMRKAARRLFWEAKQAEIRETETPTIKPTSIIGDTKKIASSIADWLEDIAELEQVDDFIESTARTWGIQREIAHVFNFARYVALHEAAAGKYVLDKAGS